MSKYNNIDWTHYHSNPGSATDTATRTMTRTKSTNSSVSASTSFNAIISEVGLGSSKSELIEVLYTVPARTMLFITIRKSNSKDIRLRS